MIIEVATTAEELAALGADWRRLEETEPHPPYYVSHRYVSAWWDAYADDDAVALRVLSVRHNGEVAGIAPLALRRRSGGSGQTVVWASHGDYLDMLVDPAAPVDTVCKHLTEHVVNELGADAVRLGNIPATSRFLHWLLRSPHNPEARLHVENPRIDLRSYDSLADFEQRSLPAKTRKYRNKLRRERDLAFRVFRGDEGNLLERIAEVHRAEKDHLQEQGRAERHSLFEDPRRVAHVRALFNRPDDVVTFGYEDAAGRLVGYRTCYRDRRTLLSWNSAYHPSYEDYRLGKVIQYDILTHLFATREADVFDLGAGRYPWKFEWTPEFTTTYRWLRPPPEPRPRRKPPTAQAGPAPERDLLGTPPPGAITPTSPDRTTPVRFAHRLARVGLGPARLARRTVHRLTHPPVIFYIPHPDDETIFMGASVHRAARDRRVVLVPLTRGSASSARSRLEPRLGRDLGTEEFTEARGAELRAAVRHLGVRAKDVLWQDLPDGHLSPDDVLRVIAEMERLHPGADHRTMSYLDPHHDHRAAGEALRRAHLEGVVATARFHLPVSLVPDRWGQRVRLSAGDLDAKRAALREYQVWDPRAGRLAVGQTSVRRLIAGQLDQPVERTHGTGYEPPSGS